MKQTLFTPEPLRRSNGRFASEAQKALDDAAKWKRTAMYLLSVNQGTADRIRRLTEENERLKQLLKCYPDNEPK